MQILVCWFVVTQYLMCLSVCRNDQVVAATVFISDAAPSAQKVVEGCSEEAVATVAYNLATHPIDGWGRKKTNFSYDR